MLPWNYGFRLDAGHIIFLGAFYLVLAVVVATLLNAAWRAFRDLRARKAEHIRWHSNFHDLPVQDRACRHELTGEFQSRECPNAFDCRECQTHARLIARNPVAPGASDEVFGMAFPLDRMYHRGHTWVRTESDGTVTVGLDELGRRLFGAPDHVLLPKQGDRVEVNGPAFRIAKGAADVRVLSPVDGKVVETGGPDSEWYLKVMPEKSDEPAFRHLLRGAEIQPWLMREMERLHLTLAAEGALPTLADGGVPVADMSKAYPQADWDAVCGEMFLEG